MKWQIDSSSAPDGELSLVLSGIWRTECNLPSAADVLAPLIHKTDNQNTRAPGVAPRVVMACSSLEDWDSGLLVFLTTLKRLAEKNGVAFIEAKLPPQIQALLSLAFSVDEREGASRCPRRRSFIEELGEKTLKLWRHILEVVAFMGDFSVGLKRVALGKSRMRLRGLLFAVQRAGPDAFPIVTLISVLVGVILAFIGSVQLVQFGAQIYIANLVAVGMTREMGPIMVGIILAGRTGAAYAAELGAMQANEEIDALKTFGVSAIDFLVMPRVLALVLMTPLLCAYADLLGILGGAMVTFSVVQISPLLFWEQTMGALTLNDFLLGLTKSVVFGILVALAGCMRGIQSGRDSIAVGSATTSAVVTGIVLIVVADAVFALLASLLGI
jgi:phospholipid/cholesterol/gamma-HCH transport system permease protein